MGKIKTDIKYWICSKCKKKYRETASYKVNIGLSYSLTPYKDICIKCLNKE